MSNIQKVVPVRKNGYILELLVPPPGQHVSVVQTQAQTPVMVQAPPVQVAQQPQEELPLEAPAENNKSFSLRNLFMR